MQIRWEGEGENEVGCANGEAISRIAPRYFRPTEVEPLLGDPTKANQDLGWAPEITAQEMCTDMVSRDLDHAKQHALLRRHGYQIVVSVE